MAWSSKRTSGYALSSLLISMIGILILLIVPAVNERRSSHLHREIEGVIEPARAQITDAIFKCSRLEAIAFNSYFRTDEMKRGGARTEEGYFKDRYEAWQRLFANDTVIAKCGAPTLERWLTGKRLFAAWYARYGGRISAMSADDVTSANADYLAALQQMDSSQQQLGITETALQQEIATAERAEQHEIVPMIVICILLALLSLHNVYRLRKFWQRDRESAMKLELAVQETNHRIKNNLQVIGALIDIQRLDAGDTVPATALDEISQQVRAVAAVHDFLSHELRSESVQADRMLAKLVSLVAAAGNLEVEVDAQEIALAVKQATAVALIANELLSNSGKHGATKASVSMRTDGASACFSVSDNGPGFPDGFNPLEDCNMGLALVNTLAHHDLAGELTFNGASGAHVELIFPIGAGSERSS